MAGRSSPFSESENLSLCKSTEIRKSFSIETLLKRTEPRERFCWGTDLHPHCLPKQVCPVPPNIAVPRRFLDTNPKMCESLQCRQCPVSSSKTQENCVADDDCDDKNSFTDEVHTCSASSSTVAAEASSTNEHMVYKRKRPRTAFSVAQIRTLEAEFGRNRYLTGSKRKELSKELKLSETQIKIWFQNRRTKLKRKNVSEMENWVQQLYSPLGPMAPRPLVIGDHLYLFTTPGSERPLYTPNAAFVSAFEPWNSNFFSS